MSPMIMSSYIYNHFILSVYSIPNVSVPLSDNRNLAHFLASRIDTYVHDLGDRPGGSVDAAGRGIGPTTQDQTFGYY